MASVEIHVPITMNEWFSVMSCTLVRSLARNADLPDDWKLTFTVSLDSTLTPASTEFAWARDYPITFTKVEPALWEAMGYYGTGLQPFTYEQTADVVLFMDADMVVVGAIGDLINRIAISDAIHGWPAWYSPPVDFDELFARAGVEKPPYAVTYSGYGIDFMSPQWGPPYFNCGFLGAPRSLVEAMGTTLPKDLEFVLAHFPCYFGSQVALTLNIVRHGYPYCVLDERYNMGTGDTPPPKYLDPEALEYYRKSLAAMADPRIIHYCVNSEAFQKGRDMASWDAVRGFLKRENLTGSQLTLQQALLALL